MNNAYDVPASIEDALLDLKGLGELITASEWKRAALVDRSSALRSRRSGRPWAFTYEGKPGGRSTAQSCAVAMSISDLAARGISGLKSRNSVAKYRKAWAKAIDDGFACDVQPGDLIDLPDVEWSDYFSSKPTKPTEDEESADSDVDPNSRYLIEANMINAFRVMLNVPEVKTASPGAARLLIELLEETIDDLKPIALSSAPAT